MDAIEILKKCDHTLLKQTATWEDIRRILDEGIRNECASCCIPPYFVRQAKEYVGERIRICTVIGFPNGYNATSVKAYETEVAVADGADEIDMVINLGAVRARDRESAVSDVAAVRAACRGKILKVIIETCLLEEDEKRWACLAAVEGGADYVKTSTGFSTAGATIEDVRLMKETVGDAALVKAAGGIRDMDFAAELIEAGASRIGESKLKQ